MDKYEFKLKVDEMKALVSARNYNAAAEIAETISWRKIRNLNALVLAGEVFEQVERYEESKEILLMAYDKSPIGRNIIYRLAEIAIKTRNFEEAQEYYDEFVDIAPHDNLKFVLKYKMTAAQGFPYKEQIQILEELKEQEYSEEWAYELAYLYHRDGQPDKCVEACDELILWFGDGIYVEKALELKMHYQPLTKPQEEKYRLFRQKRRGVIEVKPEDFLESGEIVNEAVEIPSVVTNTEKFNTTNLQNEIAKGMQQIINAREKEDVSDAINNIKRVTGEIPYLLLPEDKAMEAARQQETEESAFDDEIDRQLDQSMNMILNDEQNALRGSSGIQDTSQPVQEYPMSIEEILAEWEKTKLATQAVLREAEERKLESAKEKALQEAEKLMDRLMSIMPQLTAGVTPKELLEQEYLQGTGVLERQNQETAEVQEDLEAAGKIVAGMNKLLQEQIDNLTEGVSRQEMLPQQEQLPQEAAAATKELPDLSQVSFENEEAYAEEAYAGETAQGVYAEEIVQQGVYTEEAMQDMRAAADSYKMEEQAAETEIMSGQAVETEIMSEQAIETENMSRQTAETAAGPIAEVQQEFQELPEKIPEAAAEEPLEETPKAAAEEPQEKMPEAVSERPLEEMLKAVPERPLEEMPEAVPERPQEKTSEAFSKKLPEKELGLKQEQKEMQKEALENKGVKEEQQPNSQKADREFSQEDEEKEQEQKKPHLPLREGPRFRTQAQLQREAALGDTEEFSEEDMEAAAQAAGFYKDTPAQSAAAKQLTPEQREVFSYFVPILGMEGQIYDVLKGVSKHLQWDKDALSGNFIVEGISGSGKTVLIMNIIKVLQKELKRPNGRIGKIDANALNQKDMEVLTEKVSGGCLIIESAGRISRETAVRLSECMEKDCAGTLYVLEDTKQGIQKALERDSFFAAKFTEKISIPIFTSDDLVAFAKAYANDLDYDIDEMGVLALYQRISSIQKLDHATTLAEVKEIVDDAIDRAERGALKKVLGILTSTRYNDNNHVILREKDFEE